MRVAYWGLAIGVAVMAPLAWGQAAAEAALAGAASAHTTSGVASSLGRVGQKLSEKTAERLPSTSAQAPSTESVRRSRMASTSPHPSPKAGERVGHPTAQVENQSGTIALSVTGAPQRKQSKSQYQSVINLPAEPASPKKTQ